MPCQFLTQFYFHVTRLNFSKRKNNNELRVEKRKEKRKQNTKPNLAKMNKIFDASQKQGLSPNNENLSSLNFTPADGSICGFSLSLIIYLF